MGVMWLMKDTDFHGCPSHALSTPCDTNIYWHPISPQKVFTKNHARPQLMFLSDERGSHEKLLDRSVDLLIDT